MPTSIIKVYNSKYGKYESGARVVLEWSGLGNMGQSKAVYTDASGQAVIDHASTGTATILVNGSSKDRFYAPGSHTVSI